VAFNFSAIDKHGTKRVFVI